MNPIFLFIDFQTTGTVVETCHIIEAGWGLYDPAARDLLRDEAGSLVRLPDGEGISRTIQRLTGISDADFEEAWEAADMQKELSAFLHRYPNAPIVLHYATFKLPFLKKALLGCDDLLLEIEARVVCTHRLAKKKMPELKSHSLRAVAGFLGYSAPEKKRVADHLRATAFVWRYLQDGIRGSADKGIPREQRLGLPQTPGIYIFRDDQNRILYVGKALNLKNRVNSYFRGRKTKGSRLNEMLTRAASVETRACSSELEALLREADAIKEYDPPYNRLLRPEDRALVYFSAEEIFGIVQGGRVFGPLTSPWVLQFLQSTWTLLKPDSQQDLIETCRRIWRDRPADLDGEEEDEEDDLDKDMESDQERPTLSNLEEVAEMIEENILHFLKSLRRSRFLLRLLYADVHWEGGDQVLHLSLRGKDYAFDSLSWPRSLPSLKERMQMMDRALMDRLVIVMMRIRKALREGEDVRVYLSERLVLDADRLRQHFS